ncbi:hypothetical protein D3C86_2019300 [compost metagenome]
MELTEGAEHDLRAELDRAGAAGMIPGRAARFELDIAHRHAAGFQDRDRIGLGVEDVDRLAAALGDIRPEAAGAVQ